MLNRASRSAEHIGNISVTTQPSAPASCSDDMYSTSAGATPKHRKSDSESSSAPNRLETPSRRATRPSIASSTADTKMAITASFICPCSPKRIAVRPEHRAASVSMLGISRLIEKPRRRPRRPLKSLSMVRSGLPG